MSMSEAIRVQLAGRSLATAEVVVVACFERESPLVAGLPKRLCTAAAQAVDRKGFGALLGEMAVTRSSETGRPFVAVFGLGKRLSYDLFRLGEWLERVTARLSADGFRRATVRLPEHPSDNLEEDALFVTRTLALAPYTFDSYISKKGPKKGLRVIRIIPPRDEEDAYRRVASLAREIAAGTALCRGLSNTPPNDADPEWMTEQAKALADDYDMDIEVLGPAEMAERGMGGILSVGKGSAKPPRMVRLAWGEGGDTVSLVGKGVTFDSGGLSLKPPPSMDEMKFDKSGACTALGIARALAGAKVEGSYRCYLALAENMPDGLAYRPGDIVRCYNGKTVEILNTDAEGRMLLADALAWAEEEKPEVLVDFATLTGACVVALGQEGAGLFAPDDGLASELLSAAGGAGERLWRLPLWPDHEKQMKGEHADLRNAGGRWGGASTAAAFLAQFVERRRCWAHLDIAGPAARGRGKRSRFGATGYGVPLTMTWLLRRAGRI
jgi:leucyl aminopeptidase